MSDKKKAIEAEVVKPGTEVKEAEPNTLQPITPMTMIQIGLEKGASIEQMSQLFDLQLRWEASEAKKGYDIAMSEFRKSCPVIDKDCLVDYEKKDGSRTTYKHAGLAGALEQIQPLMAKCGFSHSWKTNQDNAIISVTCRITHAQGHSEETMLMASSDSSGGKNAIQAIGSTVQYLQRYTLFSILGLAAESKDDDGNSAGDRVDEVKTITEEQGLRIEGLLDESGIEKAGFLKLGNVKTIYDLPASQLNSAIQWIEEQGESNE